MDQPGPVAPRRCRHCGGIIVEERDALQTWGECTECEAWHAYAVRLRQGHDDAMPDDTALSWEDWNAKVNEALGGEEA
jgi:hypothetical protein